MPNVGVAVHMRCASLAVGVAVRTVSGVSIDRVCIHVSMLAAAHVSIHHPTPNAPAVGPRASPTPRGIGRLHGVRVCPFVTSMLLIQLPMLALHQYRQYFRVVSTVWRW